METARNIGARVFRIPWPDDFAAARNLTIEQARGDWIMWLDADNAVPPEGVRYLRSRLDGAGETIFWCTEVVVPVGERFIQKRVFPRRPDVRFQGRVHEQLVHPAGFESVMTPVEVVHWGYADKASARAKGERNLALLRRTLEEESGGFYTLYQMGRTLCSLGRHGEAVSFLKQTLEAERAEDRNPGLYRHAWLLLARSLQSVGRAEEAGAALEKLAGNRPDYGPGRLALGRFLLDGGEPEAAAGHLSAFLKLGVGDPVAGFSPERMRFTAAMALGRCLEETGREAEAPDAYAQAVVARPEHPEPFLACLARLALKGGRPDQARGLLNQCLAISPQNRRAREMLDEVDRA